MHRTSQIIKQQLRYVPEALQTAVVSSIYKSSWMWSKKIHSFFPSVCSTWTENNHWNLLMLKIWIYEYQNTTSDTSSDPIQISINFSPSFFFSPQLLLTKLTILSEQFSYSHSEETSSFSSSSGPVQHVAQ